MKDQGLTRKLGIHMKRSLREAARGAGRATAERLTERVPGALQEELAARAQTERKGDGLDGARTAPSFRTALALALALAHGEPLPAPGPAGQLDLLAAPARRSGR